jgi:hypothetical protein
VPLAGPAVPCQKLPIHELVITLRLFPTSTRPAPGNAQHRRNAAPLIGIDVGIIADTPSTVKWRPGSFSILGCLGFVLARRACPVLPTDLGNGCKPLSPRDFS